MSAATEADVPAKGVAEDDDDIAELARQVAEMEDEAEKLSKQSAEVETQISVATDGVDENSM